MNNTRKSGQSGFTLLEALIALLVMAFGMLALAGMQASLSRNADVAKQRTEAMRLAQERIERLRSFVGISAGAINWDNPALGAESVTTNATFTVTPTMGGTIADAMRPVSVTVAWQDRTNENQSITIASVISKSDPSDSGYLGNPLPQNKALKRVKNRNINIPIPALTLGGGKSATQFSPTYVIVYNDTDGGVIQVCNPNQADATAAQINAQISGGFCTSIVGYIVAGYVSGAVVNTSNVATLPNGINHSLVTDNSAAITCSYGQATDQNDTTPPLTYLTGYQYYVCIVPVSGTSTPAFTWDGRIRLGGIPTGYYVCRFVYSSTAVTANERNIQPYVDVNQSIDEQNYYVFNSTGAEQCTSSPILNVPGISTGEMHQDCRSSATECPAAS